MKKRLIFVLGSILIVLMAAVTLFAVNASEENQEYGLYIGGKQVTSKNLSGSGWRFEPDTNTLVLNGFEITSGGHCHKKINDGTTWLYSFIYVADEKQMDLTIRTEGKESTIGYDAMAGKPEIPSPADDGTYESYFGIYNKNGNVTITGSARLKISTNQLCIYTKNRIIADECRGGISMSAYAVGINCEDLIVRGGSQVSVTCGYSGGADNESAITAKRSISLYDTSELYANVERWSSSTKGYIAALSCPDGTINVCGGKLTGICYMGGKASDRFPECFAIQAGTLNISGGGVVEALVKTASGQKDYRKSITVGQYNDSTGRINFKGGGVLRAGIQMKDPDKGDYVLKTPQTTVNSSLYFTTSAEGYRPDGFEDFDLFIEQNAYAREGVYLREQNGVKQWSYWSDFKKIEAYPNSGIRANDVMDKNSMLKIYVLSGNHTVDTDVEGAGAPEIVVKGGSLNLKVSSEKLSALTVEKGTVTLNLTGGVTCKAESPITVARGAELVIGGDGILTELNVLGNGKVTFVGGTVVGKVSDSTNLIVDGGSINVSIRDDRNAKTSGGKSVHGFEYRISSDKEFVSVDLIALKGREYGSVGVYPIDGKIYVWREDNEKLDFVRASDADGKSYSLRTYEYQYELTEKATVKTHWRSVYVAAVGQSVSFQPFLSEYERAENYRLVWSYSDDGLNWTVIENPNLSFNGTYTHSNIKAEECNRMFRCEIRSLDDGELLDTFTTTLYVLTFSLAADGNFADGKTETIRMTEDYPHPVGKTKVRYKWSYSKDGGETFIYFRGEDAGDETFGDADSTAGHYRSQPLPLNITEDMDGWIIRCEAKAMMQAQHSDIVVAYLPITVTNKTVKIDKQPDTAPVLDLWTVLNGYSKSLTFSVTARNATKYQWQIAKRTAENPDAPFENIGGNFPTYTITTRILEYDFATKDYVYRCIISNEYSEVITEEIKPVVKIPTQFDQTNKTISVGKDSGEVKFEVDIHLGNPLAELAVYWMVKLPGANGFTRISESEELMALFSENFIMATADDGKEYCTRATLTVKNPTLELNGTIFHCYLRHGGEPDGTLNISGDHKLIVLTTCQELGHDWAEATCAAPATCKREGCGATTGEPLSHTGGKATCIHRAVCDLCDEEYGDYDPKTHPDDATDAWNEEDWDDDAGHESKWSCCGKPKYPYEYHIWGNGVCTVCGCVCNHSLHTPANCHAPAKCHTCGITYGEKDPNNHDLTWLGTYLSDDKKPNCTEEGYTGDIRCWECMEIIVTGSVIPANGHSDSWPATCKESAYCSVCEKHFGDVAPNNHAEPWSKYYENITETTHEAHWNCCDMVKTEPHVLDEDGVCKDCHYGCQHTGGTANCVEPAHCEKCGEPYGEKNPDRHEDEYAMWYPNEDGTHTKRCKCGKIISGPDSHTWENGECTVCGVSHIAHTESDWILDEAPIYGRMGLRHKVCTVCDALLTTETLEAVDSERFKVLHNCAFGNDLSMLYAILKSDLEGCINIRLVVRKENGIVEKVLSLTEYTIEGEVYYGFIYTGIAAKEMGDTLTARLEFTRDGIFYSGTVDTYSLKAYAMERLENSTNAEFKTLLVDLLNYGAAAQIYFGYRTDALVNADLPAEQKALATHASNLPAAAENGSGENVTYPASIAGKNILFGNRITLLVATSFGRDSDLDGISLRIRYTDIDGNAVEKSIDGKDFVYRDDVNGFTAYFDGLKASEFRTSLELTLVKDGKAISETVTYSLDTYVQNRLAASTDANFKALLEATLNYADSAKEYFSSNLS